MPIELVIFDIAGTLIEDHDEVTSAFLAAFLENGIQVTREELREWKGASKRAVIRHFAQGQLDVSEGLVEKTFADFRRILEQQYVESLKPIAGAPAAVETLRNSGMKTATNTGFYRGLRDAIIDRLGWRELFDAHVCSDDVAQGRPAPDMILRAMALTGVTTSASVVAVGDTPLDLQAAQNAGALGVGVLTGVHSRARLEREPHAHILSSVSALPRLLLKPKA